MYKMKRCPYCGRQIDMAAIGMKFKVAYGSPFRTCPKCHKEYIDRDYQEVALESAKAKAFRMPKVRPGILWFEVLLLCSLGMQLTGAYAVYDDGDSDPRSGGHSPRVGAAWKREASERMGEGACEGA